MFSFYFFVSAGLILASYLTGSLSSAIIIAKLWGLPDPRSSGSNNPGATNMLRIAGKLPALLTLLGDAAKGFLPVYCSKIILLKVWGSKFLLHKVFAFLGIDYMEWTLSAVFIAAVLGHLYPVFFQFKGGKGVATALGGLFGLSIGLGFSFVAIWVIVAIITRYSSLSALIAIIGVFLLAYFKIAPDYAVSIMIVAVFLFWRHRSNIRNLIQGTEGKLGRR